MSTVTTNPIDLARYNGKVTVINPETGGHRTFEIKTAKRGNLKGRRIVSMLYGPDNQMDYVGFGFVSLDGTISVWQKKRGSQFDQMANILERSAWWAEHKNLEYQFSVTCRKCNRELTTPESIASGIGPVCAESKF